MKKNISLAALIEMSSSLLLLLCMLLPWFQFLLMRVLNRFLFGVELALLIGRIGICVTIGLVTAISVIYYIFFR